VLVQGGSGAVGAFAVQIAHHHGAHVIATASAKNLELVKKLGADEVIDYETGRFEDLARDIDIVFDGVGGETRERSWRVLKADGRLISIVGDPPYSASLRPREIFFIVRPDQGQLIEMAKLLDTGALNTFVKAVVPLDDATAAYTGKVSGSLGYGKTVIEVVRD
jgi:NADPH:quinone reductase-like Zn-dependent oxidoreductase